MRQHHLISFSLILFLSSGAWADSTRMTRGDFRLPLKMELSAAQGKALPPQFEYSIEPDNTLVFSDKTIRTRLFRLVLEESGADKQFKFFWPPTFMEEGDLEVRAKNGDLIWSASIVSDEIKLEQTKIKDEDVAVNTFVGKRLGHYDEEKLVEAKVFKFCFSRNDGAAQMSYCSGPLALRVKNGQKAIVPLKSEAQQALIINEKEALPQGIVNFNTSDARLSFTASLVGGAQYKIESVPKTLEIIDVVRADEKTVVVQGHGGPPIGTDVEILDYDLWRAKMNLEKPQLVVFGSGEVPFVHPFIFFKDLPSDKDRPLVLKSSKRTTYLNKITVQGMANPGYTMDATQGNVRYSSKSGRFAWNLLNLQPGRDNRRTLLLKQGESEIHPYFEVYRGYKYDLSARLTGVLAGDGGTLLFFGEAAGSVWFERVFSSENHWLSDRRWGVALKYFGNITAADEAYQMSAIDGEVKYRLTPGVWGRDPTLGLVLGYQSFRVGTAVPVDMYGVGALWARTMPQFFDQVFNIVPFLRYPKWVDAEFVYYPMSSGSHVSMGSTYKVSFHGKMNLTRSFYLEAGFGYYSFDYVDRVANSQVQLAMSYGTGGMGINF